MNFVIPITLQIHFFSKNINGIGHMQEPNRTLLITNRNSLGHCYFEFKICLEFDA